MILIKQHRIYRIDLQNNPDILYIFGDNLYRTGYGGQAAEMRNEPNAFGIATKRSPGHTYPEDYFIDGQEDVLDLLIEEFRRLHQFLMSQRPAAIILPADGIGTGLAKMPEYSPKALEYINYQLEELKTWSPGQIGEPINTKQFCIDIKDTPNPKFGTQLSEKAKME